MIFILTELIYQKNLLFCLIYGSGLVTVNITFLLGLVSLIFYEHMGSYGTRFD